MSTIADLAIKLSLSTEDLDRGVQSVGSKISGVGGTLTKTLTPAALAVGAFGKKAFNDWHTGLVSVRAQTGATGKDLDALIGVTKKVAGNTVQNFGTVGQTVGELNSRLGLTGKPLQEVATKFSLLQDLDMPASIESTAHMFSQWGIATGKQAGTMDKLFRASQATGTTIDTLTDSTARYGPTLKAMGFGLDTSVALIAQLEKSGVNTTGALSGLRRAIGKLTEGGKPASQGLQDVVDKIKNAKTESEATGLAVKIFGSRAGVDLAAAIRSGKFEVADLTDTIANGKDTIDDAVNSTLSLSDRMTMFKNRVIGAIGPYGELIGIAGGALAAIGPSLLGLGQLVALLGRMQIATKTAAAAQWLLNIALSANPIGIVVIALAALVAALVVASTKSETFRRIVTDTWNGIKAAAQTVASWFTSAIPAAFEATWNAVKAKTNAFLSFFTTTVPAAFHRVLDWLRANWPAIATLIAGPFAPIVALATDAFGVRSALVSAFGKLLDKAREVIGNLIGLMRALPGQIRGAVGDLSGLLVQAGKDLVMGLINGITSMAGALMDKVHSLASSAVSAVKGALKINSPSLVMAGVGAGVVEGLILGIDRQTPALARAAGALAPTIVAEATPAPASVRGLATVGGGEAPDGDLVLQVDGEVLGRVSRKYLARTGRRNVSLGLAT